MADLAGIFGSEGFKAGAEPPLEFGDVYSHITQFEMDARAAGLILRGPVQSDGKLHRVATATKQRSKNGWYALHVEGDLVFGAFGDWQLGFETKFFSRGESTWSEQDRSRIRAAQERAAKEKAEAQASAAELSADVVDHAKPADSDHPYLTAKGIKPSGALQGANGHLLLPAHDVHGEIHSYQAIAPDGTKHFLKGGRKLGCFFQIGEIRSAILLCEGFATGASLHEATGEAVIVAFDTSGLGPAAEAIRSEYTQEVIVCADNDTSDGNPGLTKAHEVASWITNCRVVAPDAMGMDFNDVHQKDGQDAVRRVIFKDQISPLSASAFGNLDPVSIPPREWLYGKHLIRGFTSTTISPGGIGKTQMVMTEAIAMASGRTLLHDEVHEQCRAWHYNLEDPLDELRRRTVAICQHHKINISDIAQDFFLDSGRERPLVVAENDRYGNVVAMPDADQLYQTIRDNGISAMSIDPFVKVHYVDENSNKEIDAVASIFGQIANDTGCAFDLVHHTRKAAQGVTLTPGDVSAGRGAGSLNAAVRIARTLDPMTRDQGREFGIDDHAWYLRATDGKANMSPPAEKSDWLKRHSVHLPNGDFVGVLDKWTPPDPFDGLKSSQTKEIFHQIDEGYQAGVGEQRFGAKIQTKDRWAGHLIMDVAGKTESDAKQILKTWMANGFLVEEDYLNTTRRADRQSEKGLFVVKIPGQNA